MRLSLPGPALAALLTLVVSLPAQAAPSPTGTWLTADRKAAIRIAPCGPDLCGRIVGMVTPLGPNGLPRVDQDGRPKCGLQILQTSGAADGTWAGRITDPDDGSVWNCELTIDAQGVLQLRGYLLLPLLGKTQAWHPFTGTIGAGCQIG